MAHFAKINSENIVEKVIVVGNNDAETEQQGKDFIASIGLDGTWLQTSYNTLANSHSLGGTPFRKNYAGIGFSYDEVRDAFIPPKPEGFGNLNEETCTWIPPQPFPSWILNEETCKWNPPIPKPTDDKIYTWNESTQNWEEVTNG